MRAWSGPAQLLPNICCGCGAATYARDMLGEPAHAGDCQAAQLAFGQFTEEPLDEIQHGAQKVGRSEARVGCFAVAVGRFGGSKRCLEALTRPSEG